MVNIQQNAKTSNFLFYAVVGYVRLNYSVCGKLNLICIIALKRILKFTLKQFLHVSVQSPSSGSTLFELAKVTVVKIISKPHRCILIDCFNNIKFSKLEYALPDGNCTETCRNCFNVNFNIFKEIVL